MPRDLSDPPARPLSRRRLRGTLARLAGWLALPVTIAIALVHVRPAAQHAAPGPVPAPSGKLLFRSGFEGATALLPPVECWGTGCWQEMKGIDSVTKFAWPAVIGGGRGKFLLLTDPVKISADSIGDYMVNRIESVIGPDGTKTQALYQEISKGVHDTGPMGSSSAQSEFQFLPRQEPGDLYLSFWLKLQPDLVQKMATDHWGNKGTWRAIFAFKTGGQTESGGPANDGDYRVEAYVATVGGGAPYWAILADNNAGGGAPLVNDWTIENRDIPVPIGEWIKLEFYWHRSQGSDGRVWMAADGQVIADRRGPNLGARRMPINRIIAPLLYSGSALPIYQWVDDLEVWSGFPPGSGDDPPHAAR